MHRMHTWLSMLCPTRAPDICLAYDTFAHSLALPLLSLLHAFAHRSSRSSGLSSGAVPTPRSLSIRPTSRTTHTCSVRLLLHRPPHPHVTSHSRDPTTSRHKHSQSRNALPFALWGKGCSHASTLAPSLCSISLPHPATASSRVLRCRLPCRFQPTFRYPNTVKKSSCDQN